MKLTNNIRYDRCNNFELGLTLRCTRLKYLTCSFQVICVWVVRLALNLIHLIIHESKKFICIDGERIQDVKLRQLIRSLQKLIVYTNSLTVCIVFKLCRSNGSLFPKKSLLVGPIFYIQKIFLDIGVRCCCCCCCSYPLI